MNETGNPIDKLPQYPSSDLQRNKAERSQILELITSIEYLETLLSQIDQNDSNAKDAELDYKKAKLNVRSMLGIKIETLQNRLLILQSNVLTLPSDYQNEIIEYPTENPYKATTPDIIAKSESKFDNTETRLQEISQVLGIVPGDLHLFPDFDQEKESIQALFEAMEPTKRKIEIDTVNQRKKEIKIQVEGLMTNLEILKKALGGNLFQSIIGTSDSSSDTQQLKILFNKIALTTQIDLSKCKSVGSIIDTLKRELGSIPKVLDNNIKLTGDKLNLLKIISRDYKSVIKYLDETSQAISQMENAVRDAISLKESNFVADQINIGTLIVPDKNLLQKYCKVSALVKIILKHFNRKDPKENSQLVESYLKSLESSKTPQIYNNLEKALKSFPFVAQEKQLETVISSLSMLLSIDTWTETMIDQGQVIDRVDTFIKTDNFFYFGLDGPDAYDLKNDSTYSKYFTDNTDTDNNTNLNIHKLSNPKSYLTDLKGLEKDPYRIDSRSGKYMEYKLTEFNSKPFSLNNNQKKSIENLYQLIKTLFNQTIKFHAMVFLQVAINKCKEVDSNFKVEGKTSILELIEAIEKSIESRHDAI